MPDAFAAESARDTTKGSGIVGGQSCTAIDMKYLGKGPRADRDRWLAVYSQLAASPDAEVKLEIRKFYINHKFDSYISQSMPE